MFPESAVSNGDDDDTIFFQDLYSYKDDSYNKTITKNTGIMLIAAAFLTGSRLHFLPVIVLLFFFLNLFILLPDERTLINQKVRLSLGSGPAVQNEMAKMLEVLSETSDAQIPKLDEEKETEKLKEEIFKL